MSALFLLCRFCGHPSRTESARIRHECEQHPPARMDEELRTDRTKRAVEEARLS